GNVFLRPAAHPEGDVGRDRGKVRDDPQDDGAVLRANTRGEERCEGVAGGGGGSHPARAASIAAMSILPMVIIASMARRAAAASGSLIAASSARGVICHERPKRSLHQPQALSCPPLPVMAAQ